MKQETRNILEALKKANRYENSNKYFKNGLKFSLNYESFEIVLTSEFEAVSDSDVDGYFEEPVIENGYFETETIGNNEIVLKWTMLDSLFYSCFIYVKSNF